MTVDTLVAVAAGVLWISAGYQAQLSWRRSQPGRRRLCLTLAAVALSATLWTEAVYAAVGRALGVTNAADLLARLSLLTAAWSAQALVTEMTAGAATDRTGKASRRALVRGGVVATLLLLFAIAIWRAGTLRFTNVPGHSSVVSLYLLLFLAAMCWSVSVVMQHAWRFSRTTDRALGLALRAIALGCAAGLLYGLVKGSAIVLLQLGRPMSVTLESAAARTVGALAGATVALGCLAPAVGRLAGQVTLGGGRPPLAAHALPTLDAAT
jgi:hypothetical protein